jgi:hypothetical protein
MAATPAALRLVNKFGKPRAWPRPLADAGQAFLVDVDDAHRHLGVLARMPTLILVEQIVAQGLQWQWVESAAAPAQAQPE